MESNKRPDLFIFSRKEKRGIIVLLGVLFLFLILNELLQFPDKSISPVISIQQLGVLPEVFPSEQDSDKRRDAHPINNQLVVKKIVAFNPNKTDSQKLVTMGISSRVAGNWQKYLRKGGRFKNRKEIKRIYGMTPELFDKLEPLLLIEDLQAVNDKMPQVKKPVLQSPLFPEGNGSTKDRISIDINKADSAALEDLPGIGPVLASRIVHFRQILGGFYSVSQLREVYGLREEHFSAASPYLFTAENGINKFNINFATLAELGRHPYIGYRLGRRLINLRDQHGKFHSAEELIEIGEDSLKKLRPYLIFEQ